ncbi:hypothetical protein AHAS_Ahas04G0161000 [Arachis hypogaea]
MRQVVSYIESGQLKLKIMFNSYSVLLHPKVILLFVNMFLASNSAAGSVIGKGGSTITDFQSQSGARIQLSHNHEFFPGTTDRIIMVSGGINEILRAVELILSKLLSELQSEDENDAEPKTKVRLIVPNGSCGGIIGKGGSTIRSFIEESQAGIKISPQNNNYYGLNDRLVTLTGTLDDNKCFNT